MPNCKSTPLDAQHRREADMDLAAACAQGDCRAQRTLADRMFDLITSTVSFALNSRTFADDAVQDTLMELLHSMKHYRGECSLETWARKIAVRTSLRHIRKTRRRERLMVFFPRPEPVLPDGESGLSDRELRLHLNALISRLPEKQQVAIRLRFVHELSYREISRIVDAPEETVRDRVKKGRNRLKQILTNNPVFADWLREGRD